MSDADVGKAEEAHELHLVSDTAEHNGDWLGDDDYDENGRRIPGTNERARWLHPGARRSSVRIARAMDRRRKVLELRATGMSFAQIASQLGFNTVGGARQAYSRALDDVREVGEEYRDLQLARLERAVSVLMPMIDEGDTDAVDKLVKVIDRIAKLAGLDKVPPRMVQVDGDLVVNQTVQSVEAVTRLLEAYPHLLQPVPGLAAIEAERE